MGLLRTIPNKITDDAFPFLREIDFTQYEERLAATALMQRDAPGADAHTAMNRIVQSNLRLDDLRMILASSGSNSAWITGKKGVGKTTLVDALLRARAQKRLTSQLMGKPFFIFDVNDFFVEGADGEWVDKFRKSLDLVAQRHGLVIINHIDDFVQMAKGDAGRLINALVSRLEKNGGFQSIIISEDEKSEMVAEASTGIARRFVQLPIDKEPALNDLKPILMAHFVRLEAIHNVNFTDEAADEIIRLLTRFPGQAFTGARPANAIAFADSVAAYVRMNMYAEPAELAVLREKLGTLHDMQAILGSDGKDEAFAEAGRQIAELQPRYDAEHAAWMKKFEPLFAEQAKLDQLTRKAEELEQKGSNRTPKENDIFDILAPSLAPARAAVQVAEKALYPEPPRVTARHVQAVFNDRAGVSFESMNEDTIERLGRLEPYLNGEIFLQDAAKKGLARVYRAREMGVSNPSGPAGVMLFTGGTGLGKTELTEVLARFDGGENAKPIRIALSEYKGKGAVSRLTGADPGLIGFDKGSPTLEEVEKNPRAILMLDEIDKADPSVFDVLMQILEKGEIRLASGKLLDFRNTIIVLGSNALKADDLSNEEMAHQDLHQDGIRQKLLQVRSRDSGEILFRPEFIRRIRDIYVFQQLGKPQYVDILLKEVGKVNRDYGDNNIKVDVDKATAEALVNHFNIDSMGGGGPGWIVNHVIRSRLTDYLTDRLTETRGDKSKIHDRLRIEFKDGAPVMERVESADPQPAGRFVPPKAALAPALV